MSKHADSNRTPAAKARAAKLRHDRAAKYRPAPPLTVTAAAVGARIVGGAR